MYVIVYNFDLTGRPPSPYIFAKDRNICNLGPAMPGRRPICCIVAPTRMWANFCPLRALERKNAAQHGCYLKAKNEAGGLASPHGRTESRHPASYGDTQRQTTSPVSGPPCLSGRSPVRLILVPHCRHRRRSGDRSSPRSRVPSALRRTTPFPHVRSTLLCSKANPAANMRTTLLASPP